MNPAGWRTVVVDRPQSLTLRDEQMVVSKENTTNTVPVEQIRELMITGGMGSLSVQLLNRLIGQHSKVIICDEKHVPLGEVLGIDCHSNAAGCIMDQAAWTDRRKHAVWRQIVAMKIRRQMDALRLMKRNVPFRLAEYSKQVESDDAGNREALAARLYFDAMFGNSFRRHANDAVNAALNYGYTILTSEISRLLALHGYSSAMGIHHCSRDNRVNLSCDLVEPFRPFADRVVALRGGAELDWDYRRALIDVLNERCVYDGKTMLLKDAMDCFVLDTLDAMGQPRRQLKEVKFYE